MEIESKPHEMDRFERRLIQLKIEREALKKEPPKTVKDQLSELNEEIDKASQEYGVLEEVWKKEKALLEGASEVKELLEQARMEMETARRAGEDRKSVV